MRIDKFEDLIAWQEARKSVNLVYDITQKNSFKDFVIANQIQKAAVSVMISKNEFQDIYTQSVKTNKLINGLIKNVKYQITREHENL